MVNFVKGPETNAITLETLKNDAEKVGFTFGYRRSNIRKRMNEHQYISGKIFGKDFKVEPGNDIQAVTLIRVFGGLNQHEAEFKALGEGQEIHIATVNFIEYSAEYVDKDYGYVDYSVTKNNGKLLLKIFDHAPIYISSNDQPKFIPIDEYIDYWTKPTMSLGGFALSKLD